MRSSWLWPTINLLTTLATSVIVFVVPASPLQPYVVMSFVCFCPGMALVRFLRLHDLAVELSLAVALSLSVASIVAGALLYAKHWSPLDTLTTLVLLTLTCSIAQLIMQLPIVGIAAAPKHNEDIATSETISMAALKGAAGEQHEVVKESTPLPSSHVRKAAWGLEESTTLIPAATDQRSLHGIEQAAASESHKKEIEKAATTIMPAAVQQRTKQSVAEKDTTLLAAVSSSSGSQRVEEKDTTLLAAVSSSPGSQSVEEKDTTLLPSAGPQSVEEKETVLTPALIETQDTQELHKEEIISLSPTTEPPETPKIEEKKAAITPSVTKPPETPATAEKKAASTVPLTEPQQPQEEKEKEHTDKRPAVPPPRPKAANRDRDTDANMESNNEDLASRGETPHPLPALSSPVGARPVLRKRRLLNQ